MRFCTADGRLLFMDVEGWGLEFLPYFKKKKKKSMGTGTSSLERHIEQAKKTGACNLEGMSLTKVRKWTDILIHGLLYAIICE